VISGFVSILCRRMFEGFEERRISLSTGVDIRFRIGGDGPTVVLLHGHPRTHTTWHRVAPLLVERGFAVVCPDLRGYGGSSAPDPDEDRSTYSKRSMASDVVELLSTLGKDRFSLVGHDRGSYVAFRLALDHPGKVDRLVLLDCVPIGDALDLADARFATLWWHWFFYAQPDQPERAILADPLKWYGGDPLAMGAENYGDFVRAVTDPATVSAMLEDYRSGITVDGPIDEADRLAGNRITRPTLVLWSEYDDLPELYGRPEKIWKAWADDLKVGLIPSGHHMAEEAPKELVDAVVPFLSELSEPPD
jgi:haloacetate dehalogenase